MSTTRARPRFVDAHMHLWDVRSNPWYCFPMPGNDFGLGLKTPFPDRYVLDDYMNSNAVVALEKCVHVTAVTAAKDVEAESRWITGIAGESGLPSAVIGTVDLENPSAVEATLDRETANPLYRGIRLLAGMDYESELADGLLLALLSRNLIYDAVAHPGGGIANLVRACRRREDLTVVLEHTGWPLATDEHSFDIWRKELRQFAALPQSYCKLSGLAMTVHSTSSVVFRRYFDECIELFGTRRCMFASNFPVDLSYGSPNELFSVFRDVADGLSRDESNDLYARTAECVYRI